MISTLEGTSENVMVYSGGQGGFLDWLDSSRKYTFDTSKDTEMTRTICQYFLECLCRTMHILCIQV